MEVPRSPDKGELFLAAACVCFALTMHPIGFAVAVNGLICHLTAAFGHPSRHACFYWDAAVNASFIIFTNCFPKAQPILAIISSFAIVCFFINNRGNKKPNPTFHFVCVQLPLFIGLLWFNNNA